MELRPFKSRFTPSKTSMFGREFSDIQREMSEVLDSFFGASTAAAPQIYNLGYYPAVDIQDKEDKYLLEAELPGMKESEVDLSLHNNILTIKGEKKLESKTVKEGYTHSERLYGQFRRDIPFDDLVDADKVKAKLQDGILSIEIMKQAGAAQSTRKIAIKH